MGLANLKIKDIFIFLLSIVLAAGVALLLKFFMFAKEEVKSPRPLQTVDPIMRTTKVLVASSDVEVGSQLEANMLQWQLWPSDDLPSDYIIQKGDGDLKKFEKEMIVVNLKKGDPIRETYLASFEGNNTLPAIITPGMRALTMSLDRRNSLSINLLSPGDHVDVLISAPNSGGDERRKIQRIVENVKVLAVEHFINRVESKKLDDYVKAVTIEVSPADAEKITFDLNDNGVPFLALRDLKSYRQKNLNPKEIQGYTTPLDAQGDGGLGHTLQPVVTAAPPIPPQEVVKAESPPTIIILRGDKREETPASLNAYGKENDQAATAGAPAVAIPFPQKEAPQ